MKSHLIYSDKYDFNFFGLNRIHPFYGLKFSKAWEVITKTYPYEIESLWVKPENKVTDDMLGKLHSTEYITSLNRSSTIASVIEIGLAKYIPASLLHKALIDPIKLATQGTIQAAEYALKNHEIVMNIGGGYHHAFADHGEGFCFFADAALSLVNSRDSGLLKSTDTVLMIDLDAHRGNGFESVTENDSAVKIFDIYGFQTYPGLHEGNVDKYPYMIPLKSGINDDDYLNVLEAELTMFLDANKDAKLVYYNAGNDILDIDPLGGMSVSYDGVVKRDNFVIDQLTKRCMPSVVMTSGGYTEKSYELIADLAKIIIEKTLKVKTI